MHYNSFCTRLVLDKSLQFGKFLLERVVNLTLESKVMYLLFNYVDCFYNFCVAMYLVKLIKQNCIYCRSA